MKNIEVTVNGVIRGGIAKPGQTLLDFLRNELNCVEVKQGCGRGDCGSCSVIMDGNIIDSCLVLAYQAEGTSILTSAGLGDDENPHPIQKAFIETGAIQCGFCTPGVVMASKALLDREPQPTEEQIKRGLSGNLCRCTGYKKIVEAVALAAGNVKSSK